MTNQWKMLFCIAIAMSAICAQYIPFPDATHMDRQAPYLNPSVNDPIFYSNKIGFGPGVGIGVLDEAIRVEVTKFLGNNVYYDSTKKIFINIATGDYYDPTTGLVYRRVVADRTGFVNGRVGPNPASSNYSPAERSDPVDIPSDLKSKYLNQLDDSMDYDEDCNDCERKGQCFRCKRISSAVDCSDCWSGKFFSDCNHCYRETVTKNLPYQKMGELIVSQLSAYRRSNGLKDVRFNQHLYDVSMIQNLYMANRGYLSNDNFLANISTFRGGAMTTGYIMESNLSDQDGAIKFMNMWKRSPEHNANLLINKIDQCGAAVYFDQKNNKFIATLVCVKL